MILIDATPLQTEHRFRGPGVYTAGLLDALTRPDGPGAGWPVALLEQRHRAGDAPLLADLAARHGVTTVLLRRPRRPHYHLQWLLSELAIRPALRRARAHLYHATEPNGLVMVPGMITVATLYDLIPLHHPGAHFPMRRLEQRVGYARYLRQLLRADRLLAISAASKRDAVERLGVRPERIAVVPLAVDERRFYPRPAHEVDAVIAGLKLRRPYFLHVGAAAYHKNTATMLRAFEQFRREGGAHTLYIAGHWPPRTLAGLAAQYADLTANGHLHVLGYVLDDDLPALYGGADALVYPSLVEGFGLPVLEAMRCGTPVLTSNTSSLPEVGGDAALYVDPLKVDEIAAALRRLAESAELRADLAARGVRRAAQFTWQRTAEQTWQVYQGLLSS